MIHGPADVSEMVEPAKLLVQQALVARAEADGTPATLRAMYVLKAAQATRVLAGEESLNRGIEREAELRGVTAEELATTILTMAAPSVDLEVYRMQINCQIEQAATQEEIVQILAQLGLEFKS